MVCRTREVPSPALIRVYYKNMGGVNVSDASWDIKMFYHFVDIWNIFILLKMLAAASGQNIIAQKQFRHSCVCLAKMNTLA